MCCFVFVAFFLFVVLTQPNFFFFLLLIKELHKSKRIRSITLICILLQIKHYSKCKTQFCFEKSTHHISPFLKNKNLASWIWLSCTMYQSFSVLGCLICKNFLKKKRFVEEWCKLKAKCYLFVTAVTGLLFTKVTSGKLVCSGTDVLCWICHDFDSFTVCS